MGSMNNWLGFSLSPQEVDHNIHSQPQPQPHQDHSHSSASQIGFNPDEISGAGECYDHLTSSHSNIPSLNLPAPFGILEAFNRSNTSQSQDWNSDNHQYMGNTSVTSCTSHNLDDPAPKLENFLGGHSFSAHDHHHYMYAAECSLQPPAEEAIPPETTTNGGGNSNIGLSMIKNWLRNQQIPTLPENNCSTGTQTLSLSMSTDSQTGGSPLPLLAVSGGGESVSQDNTHQKESSVNASTLDAQTGAIESVPRKSIDTFGQRTSIYRGVTRHRWTGRYEAHLWDNSCRREGQTRKGRQVYLGGYDKEEKAARAYDLAALKYWGTTTTTNFPISNYEKELEEMKHMTRQEFVASLRRKSSGFSRGASIYRGVTRHHQHGRWQARIGRVAGNKDLYLGTFSTQEEAAEAYDIAAIKFRGLNAVTNFDMSRYDVKSILESSTLPIGGAAKRLKDAEQSEMTMDTPRTDEQALTSHLTHGTNSYGAHHGWPSIAFQQAQPLSMHYPYGQQQRVWCKQEQDDNVVTHSFQDLNQLQLGNTHNFFQPSFVHNIMSLDSSSMEHSSGSNSNLYSGAGGESSVGYGSGNSNFIMPMATVIHQDGNIDDSTHGGNGYEDNNEIKSLGYENVFGSSDPYHARNMYYLSQQSSVSGGVKASVYDQGSGCNNWVPTAVPTLAARGNTMAVCHGAQPFTVWNDT